MALSAPVRPRHVLVVARWYPSHDVPARGTFVADLVAALVDQGLRVSVASFETVQPATADPVAVESLAAVEAAWAAAVRRPEALSRPRSWGVAGVPVARLPAVRTWVRGERIDVAEQAARHAGPLLAFGRALADRDPFDLIHAHTGLPDGLASAELADALRLPLLVTEHDSTLLRRLDQDPVALSHYRRLLGGRRRVVAVSEALATGLGARLDLEAPPDVLPNALPTGIFRPGPRQARDPDELLWVGARVSHKGTDRLLRAFALARRERPGLRLRAIGPSPGGDESWLALAEELGVRDAVSFEPAADRQAVAAAMRRAGLLVHPSPAETFGMVAAEALASGLPVAATPSGGVEGIIGRDGRAGELAAGMAPEALAQAILRALARRPSFDPQDLHDRVAQAFGPQVVATRVMAAYDALLEAGSLEAGRAAPPSLRASTPGSAPASPRPTTSTTKSGDRERVLIVARGASAAQRLARLPAVVGPAVSILVRPGSPPPAIPARAHLVPETTNRPRLAQRLRLRGGLLVARLRGTEAVASARARRQRRAVAVRRAWRGRGVGAVIGVGTGSRAKAEAAPPTWLVAADAGDVQPILDAGLGAALAPGSLRWLADRCDENDGPMAP